MHSTIQSSNLKRHTSIATAGTVLRSISMLPDISQTRQAIEGRLNLSSKKAEEVHNRRMSGPKTGPAALQSWCRSACVGYPGVDITNMSSAWRDGRAFCAVIHRYRPDVLDWGMVDPQDWRRYSTDSIGHLMRFIFSGTVILHSALPNTSLVFPPFLTWKI